MKKTILIVLILLATIPFGFSQSGFVAAAGNNAGNCSWSFGQLFSSNSVSEVGFLNEGLQQAFLYIGDDTLLVYAADVPYEYRIGHVITKTGDTTFYLLPTYGLDSLMSVMLYAVTCPNDSTITAPYSVCSIPVTMNRPLVEPAPAAEVSVANNAPAEFPCDETTTVTWQLAVADKTLDCQQNITVLFPPCGGSFTVTDANNYVYNTLRLGCLCWTKENLKSTVYDDGLNTPIPIALIYQAEMYPDTAANLANFGRLYSWYSAMKVPEGDNAAVPDTDEQGYVQGVCPEGWRVPTLEEYQRIYAYSSPDLRTIDSWLTAGNNSSNFSASPGGIYNSVANSCFYLRGDAFFWTANATATLGQYVHLTCNCPDLLFNDIGKVDGMSIRCLKN